MVVNMYYAENNKQKIIWQKLIRLENSVNVLQNINQHKI